jgi:hypothetical protein
MKRTHEQVLQRIGLRARNRGKLEEFLSKETTELRDVELYRGVKIKVACYVDPVFESFVSYVWKNGLIENPAFDPDAAYKQFISPYVRYAPPFAVQTTLGGKARDAKGKLAKALIRLDAENGEITNDQLIAATFEITERVLKKKFLKSTIQVKHRKRVYDAFRNNPELLHRSNVTKKK